MEFRKNIVTYAAAGAISVGLVFSASTAIAESFTLRIAAGHPAPPLSPVNQLQKTFVPNVTKRVAAETADRLAKHPAAYPELIVTSARKGQGIPDLRAAIAALMGQALVEE